MDKPRLVKCLAVRLIGSDHLPEISITADDHRVYSLTARQLRLLVKCGMEVLSRLDDRRAL
jgi:hypothetical protein